MPSIACAAQAAGEQGGVKRVEVELTRELRIQRPELLGRREQQGRCLASTIRGGCSGAKDVDPGALEFVQRARLRIRRKPERLIERTRLLLHLVDAAGVDGRNPVDDYRQINEELRQYQPELARRPQIVVLNKTDLPEAHANLDRLRAAITLPPSQVFDISAATRAGVDALMQHVAARLLEIPGPNREARDEQLTWPVPEVDERLFSVEPEGAGWRVRGKKIERLISMTNFAQSESLMRIQRVMQASGISNALITAGVQEGDTVYIEKAALTWADQE